MAFNERNAIYWERRVGLLGRLDDDYADFEHRQYLADAARRAALPIRMAFEEHSAEPWCVVRRLGPHGSSWHTFSTKAKAMNFYLALRERLEQEQKHD